MRIKARSFDKISSAALCMIMLCVNLTLCQIAHAQDAEHKATLYSFDAKLAGSAREQAFSVNHDRTDQEFFEARSSKAEGKLLQAIQAFREILQRDPGYINARRELAHTLLLTRDYEASSYHFKQLLQVDENEYMRAGYRHFLTTIEQNQPIGWSSHFALLPSSNVNRGTNNSVLDTGLGQFSIAPESQAQSGIGTQIGLSGFVRDRASSSRGRSFNWEVIGALYEEDRFNNATGSLSFSHHHNSRNGSWLISPYAVKHWRRDDADRTALGLKLDLEVSIDSQSHLGLSASYEYRDYLSQNYRDGIFSTLSARMRRTLLPGLSANIGLNFKLSSPETAHLQFKEISFASGVTKSWAGGLSSSMEFEIGTREYNGDFPLTTFSRSDETYIARIGLHHSQIKINGLVPRLSCAHTLNQSNINFFAFDTTECRLSIAKKF